jgi:uncharacterized protein
MNRLCTGFSVAALFFTTGVIGYQAASAPEEEISTCVAPEALPATPADCRTAEQCFERADNYYHGRDEIQSYAQAVPFLEWACAQDHAEACAHLGLLHESGQALAYDPARARELYQQACDGGDAGGCADLARVYTANARCGRGYQAAQQLSEKAFSLAEASCETGNQSSCVYLGSFYENGVGVERDPAKALSIYQASCDTNYVDGCLFLGLAHSNTLAFEKAEAPLQMACQNGYLLGCEKLRQNAQQ